MASNLLKKIQQRIRAIRRMHPSLTFKQASGKAWKEYHAHGGKVAGVKRKKSRKKPRRKARRIGTTSSPHVDRVDRKKVEISIGTVAGHKARAAHLLKERLGRQLLQKEMTTTATGRRKVQKSISHTRSELRALGY